MNLHGGNILIIDDKPVILDVLLLTLGHHSGEKRTRSLNHAAYVSIRLDPAQYCDARCVRLDIGVVLNSKLDLCKVLKRILVNVGLVVQHELAMVSLTGWMGSDRQFTRRNRKFL